MEEKKGLPQQRALLFTEPAEPEYPAGTKHFGSGATSWTGAVYTADQQHRLQVTEMGEELPLLERWALHDGVWVRGGSKPLEGPVK